MAHRDAVDDLNRWRGRCIDNYARIEQASIRAVKAFIDHKLLTRKDDQPMFGARLKAVETALNDPRLVKSGKSCRDALDALRAVLDRRNILVHSTGQIWIDKQGDWLWSYHFVCNAKGNPQEDGTIDHEQAEDIERTLVAKSRSFSDLLDNLVGKLRDTVTD